MLRNLLLYFCVFLLTLNSLFSQSGSVGIGTTNPNNSAALEIQSSTKGLLLPRVSTAQRKAITSPAVGLLVFDTDKNALFLFDGAVWRAIGLVEGNNLPLTERGPTDSTVGQAFGWSVSMSGNYAIVGSPYDSVNSNPLQGSAFIFARQGNNWVQQARLTASDGAASELFGHSVAISGDFAVVGCPYDDVFVAPLGVVVDRGSVYVFTRTGSTWTQTAKLIASDGLSGEAFGFNVAISGNRIVAAPESGRNASNVYTGAAYIFSFSSGTWTQTAKLVPPDGAASDRFGISTSVSDEYIAIGASGHGVGGAVYIYFRFLNTWVLDEKLMANTPQNNEGFGATVHIIGTKVLIGAVNFDGPGGTNQGAAYTYIRNGTDWVSVDFFSADDGGTNEWLGSGVAFFGNYAIVGAPGDDVGFINGHGSVYLLKLSANNSWVLIRKIEIDNDVLNFGTAVAMDGLNLIIGATSSLSGKGKVYFLNLE